MKTREKHAGIIYVDSKHRPRTAHANRTSKDGSSLYSTIRKKYDLISDGKIVLFFTHARILDIVQFKFHRTGDKQ